MIIAIPFPIIVMHAQAGKARPESSTKEDEHPSPSPKPKARKPEPEDKEPSFAEQYGGKGVKSALKVARKVRKGKARDGWFWHSSVDEETAEDLERQMESLWKLHAPDKAAYNESVDSLLGLDVWE